jgi:hypothetical protein
MRSVLRDRYQLALAPAPELRPEITPGNLLPEIDPEPNYVIAARPSLLNFMIADTGGESKLASLSGQRHDESGR